MIFHEHKLVTTHGIQSYYQRKPQMFHNCNCLGNDVLNDEQGNHLSNGHMGSTLHWDPFFSANKYELTTASR